MLLIGGVVAAFAVVNGVYPAVQRSSDAVSTAADTVNDRMTSQIQIIEVGEAGSEVEAWVKNVGSTTIEGIENSDIFIGSTGNMTRIGFGNILSPLPYWSYQLQGTSNLWGQAVTNEITIALPSPPAAGAYFLKMVLPNGVSDEASFSVGN